MEGWIKLHREIVDHWIFQDCEKFKWWVDLLLMANHEKKKMVFGNKLFLCDRGQTVRSLKTLSERWNVGRGRVRAFLKLLTNDTMIVTENLTHTTRITICNYDYWQTLQHANNTPITRKQDGKQPPNETLSDTNKNDKNVKEYYREQIKVSKDNKDYTNFVWFLFEKNDTGKPLDSVLKLKQQISWEHFQVLQRKIEIMKDHNGYSGTLKQKVLGYINGDYKKKVFFGTMDTWITGDANKLKIELPDNDELRKAITK